MSRVEGVGLSLLMAVFALLEDALAFGALGNLPGAPTADLTMLPPTSIALAPSSPSRNNGSSRSSSASSRRGAELDGERVLACLDVSC